MIGNNRVNLTAQKILFLEVPRMLGSSLKKYHEKKILAVDFMATSTIELNALFPGNTLIYFFNL